MASIKLYLDTRTERKDGTHTIKRLGPGVQKGHYTLVPTNKDPEYGIQEISKNKIDKIFSVLGCMKRF